LPPLSTTPVVDTGGTRVIDTGGSTLTCEYLRLFIKKIGNDPNVISGAWGKVIHEKNLKKKIL
jgi:hypothetical protein